MSSVATITAVLIYIEWSDMKKADDRRKSKETSKSHDGASKAGNRKSESNKIIKILPRSACDAIS